MQNLNLLLERSLEVTRELSKLSEDILFYFADLNSTAAYVRLKHTKGDTFLRRNSVSLREVFSDRDKLKMYNLLNQFIKDNIHLTIILANQAEFDRRNNSNALGFLRTLTSSHEVKDENDEVKIEKKIEKFKIYLNYDASKLKGNLLYIIKTYDKQGEDVVKRNMRSGFGMTFRSILIHELRHAYDAYVSNLKYYTDKESRAFYEKKQKEYEGTYERTQEDKEAYWRLPHEYWARYAEAIDGLIFRKDWNLVLADFKKDIGAWHLIDKEGKRKLIKALSVVYLEEKEKDFKRIKNDLISKGRSWDSVLRDMDRRILYKRIRGKYKDDLMKYLRREYIKVNGIN